MHLDLHLQWPPTWWLRRQEERQRQSQASEEATLWRRFQSGELEDEPIPPSFSTPVYTHSGEPLLQADEHRYLRAFHEYRKQGMPVAQAVSYALFAIGTKKDAFGREVSVAGFPPLLDHSGWEYAAQEEVLRRLEEEEEDDDPLGMEKTVRRAAVRSLRPLPITEQPTMQVSITERPTMQVPVTRPLDWLNTAEQDEEFTWGQVRAV